MGRGDAEPGPRHDERLGGADVEGRAGTEPPEQAVPDQDDAEMRRLRHDMEVANDWNPARDLS